MTHLARDQVGSELEILTWHIDRINLKREWQQFKPVLPPTPNQPNHLLRYDQFDFAFRRADDFLIRPEAIIFVQQRRGRSGGRPYLL